MDAELVWFFEYLLSMYVLFINETNLLKLSNFLTQLDKKHFIIPCRILKKEV